MASTQLANRYKRYRAGTAKLVNWLANTARKCIDITDIIPAMMPSKTASKQAKSKRKNAAASEQSKILLSTADLLKLTEIVAYSTVAVPENILTVARDVIAGREASASFYAAIASAEDTEGIDRNKTHQHFIEVLHQIVELLQNAKGGGRQDMRATRSPDHQSYRDLSNLFSCLEVEEPSPAMETNEALEIQTQSPMREGINSIKQKLASRSSNAASRKKKGPPAQLKFELQQPDDEVFATWCFLTDLRDLREQVRAVWADFKTGKVTFGAASMITDVSFHILKHAERELVSSFPYLCHYNNVLDMMQVTLGAIDKTLFLFPKRRTPLPDLVREPAKRAELAELLCPVACTILRVFRDAALEGKHDPVQLVQSLPNHLRPDRAHPFGRVLVLETLPEIMRLASELVDVDVIIDPFTMGLVGLIKHPEMTPPWLVGACQIYLDALDVIEGDTGAGLQYLRMRAQRDRRAADNYYDVVGGRPTDTGRRHAYDRAIEVIERISKCHLDGTLPNFNVGEQGLTVSALPRVDADNLHKCLPLLSGIQMNSLAICARDTGLNLGNLECTVLTAAYLYKAALKVGVLKTEWPDMEFVLTAQSRMRPLLWRLDVGPEFLARRFGIALGLRASSFVNGRRPKLPKYEVIMQQFQGLGQDLSLTNLLFECGRDKANQRPIEEDFIRVAVESLARLEKTSPQDTKAAELHKQWKSTGKLTPSQLLYGFTEVFVADEPELNFDHVQFFYLCQCLLTDIWDACSELPPLPSSDDWGIRPYELAYAALWGVADYQQYGSIVPGGPVMYVVGLLMDPFIEKEGQLCSTPLENPDIPKQGPLSAAGCNGDDESEQLQHLPPVLVNFYKEHGIPIPGMYNTGPQFCNSLEEWDLIGEAAMAMREYCQGKDRNLTRLKDAALMVAAAKLAELPDKLRTALAQGAIDKLAEEAEQMSQYQFDNAVNTLLDNHTSELRKYLREKLADVPRMIAKEERETRELGKAWTGDEWMESRINMNVKAPLQ